MLGESCELLLLYSPFFDRRTVLLLLMCPACTQNILHWFESFWAFPSLQNLMWGLSIVVRCTLCLSPLHAYCFELSCHLQPSLHTASLSAGSGVNRKLSRLCRQKQDSENTHTLSLSLCIYVYMYIYTHACMCIYIHTYLHIHAYVIRGVYVYIRLHMCKICT